MDAEAFRPPADAVIVARHTDAPVTTPAWETVATPGESVDHVTAIPVITFPAASLGVAVSCTVAPTAMSAFVGSRVIYDTRGVEGSSSVGGGVGSLPHAPSNTMPMPTSITSEVGGCRRVAI